MLLSTLRALYRRDLEKLKGEIAAYINENDIWKIQDGISNSAGNLCLHLVGNLNTYIGAEIGKTGYIRNRELEFSLKDVPRQELLDKISSTIQVVDNSLSMMKEEDLEKEYPLIVFADKMSTGYFLVHLVAHLGYHLGQVNYHRRLIDKKL